MQTLNEMILTKINAELKLENTQLQERLSSKNREVNQLRDQRVFIFEQLVDLGYLLTPAGEIVKNDK